MGKGSNDWVLLTAGFVLGALVVLVFVGPWPDSGGVEGAPTQPFWRFLWQWQNALAGIAAIGAAAAAWMAAGRQVEEMRWQFRHHMDVTTIAERNAADRELQWPSEQLDVAIFSIGRISEAAPELASEYYFKGLRRYARPLTRWLRSPPEPVLRYLRADESSELEFIADQLAMMPEDFDGDVERLGTLRSNLSRAKTILEAVRARVRAVVPT